MAEKKDDVAYFGATDEAGVRFAARGLAIMKMIQAGGPVPEPTGAQIAEQMDRARRVVRGEVN